jgi:hypothetical protein
MKLLSSLLLLLLISSPLSAQSKIKEAPPPRPPLHYDFDQNAITAGIKSGGAAADEAVATIEKLILRNGLQGGYAMMAFRYKWSRDLFEEKRFEEINHLGKLAVLTYANQTYHTEDIQRWRVKALSAMNRHEEALGVAKGYFNIARLEKTADALDTVLRCLKAAYPNDPELIERFKREQQEGALLTRAPSPSKNSVLKSIKIPATEIEDAMAHFQRLGGGGGDLDHQMAAANLLLLADRCDEAHEILVEAYNGTVRDSQLHDAMESVPRAIKAQDGTIGRANQWLLENRPR